MNKLEVLYEDNHIIVVVKPENVLSQGDSTKDLDMLTIIKDYIKNKYNKPGNVYLGLVHRLDRPVSGVMVFARSSKAASRLSLQIRNNEFHKEYMAVIRGANIKEKGEFKDYLLKLDDGNTIVTDSKRGKLSVLYYEVLDRNIDRDLALVKIKLITGRHHQIRVQFASRNHPLYGDQRYGRVDNNQIALLAYMLSFKHPITKEELIFKCSVSKNNDVWSLFDTLKMT